MAILSRPKIHPQQRFDLEDWEALLSSLRADSKLYTKQFESDKNLILKGFDVSGIGLKEATVLMSDATLIIPEGTFDFSYFISSLTELDITVPDSDLIDNTRNYLEIQLCTLDGTPLSKAFWDADSNEGVGQEFNQIVNTITDIKVTVVTSIGGFSGSTDSMPLAKIDTDSSGNITSIFDKRDLFYRLSTTSNLDNDFNWGTQIDPTNTLVMTGVTGTFTIGETITINGETAIIETGGTTTITANEFSGDNFFSGNVVTGGTSGATGTLSTSLESFTGADKSINSNKDSISALQTEIKSIKGTRFWFEKSNNSLIGIAQFINSIITQNVPDASYAWDGSALSITDANGSPLNADELAGLRILGNSQDLLLTRQDSAVGSASLTIADGSIIYVKIPSIGDRTYSDAGSGDTNFQTVTKSSYISNDENYWIAYREGDRVYIRGYGELQPGESAPISDPAKAELEALIAAVQDKVNQDRNSKLIEGGTWNLANNGTDLTLSLDAYIKIAGLEDVQNTISAQTISLPNAESVAYVTESRSGTGANVITVTVSDIDTITLTDGLTIIARRVSNGVLIGNSFLLKPNEYLELDGALAEVNRHLGQLNLKKHETDDNKIRINPADSAMLNSDTLSQVIGDFLLDFDGAVIDFTTGETFKNDGTTPLGNDFTPFTIPVSEYFWYGVALIPGTVTSGNKQLSTIQVTQATNSDLVVGDAPQSQISGDIKLGAIQIFNNAGVLEVFDIVRLGVGSGSGVSGGSDSETLIPVSGFQAIERDDFTTLESDADIKIETSISNGIRDVNNNLYKLLCDKSLSCTTIGTGYTLTGDPSGFSLSVGDVIWNDTQTEFRKVNSITSTTPTAGQLDSAFTVDLTAESVMVSQAVWTKDIVNLGDATQKTRPRDFFSGDISTLNINYDDSLITADAVPDFVDEARVVISAATDGVVSDVGVPISNLFNKIFTRPQAPNQIDNYELNTAALNDERLFLVYFCNPANASITTQANVIKSEVSFYAESVVENGGVLKTAYCMSDGSGTPNNCTNPTVVLSKTQIELDWSYAPNANSGDTKGQLQIFVDGQEIPRFVTGVTVDAYFKEIAGTGGVWRAIEFHTDLSGVAVSIEILKSEGVVDTNTQNTGNIATNTNDIATNTSDITSNESLLGGPVGTIMNSMLTLAQFQGQMGTTWVLCDGANVSGSLYHTVTGLTNVPNTQSEFLRGATSDVVGVGAGQIGSTQSDATNVNGLNTTTGGDHNHGGTTNDNGDHSHTTTVSANVYISGTSAIQGTSNNTGLTNLPTSTDGDHNHTIPNSGTHSHTITSSDTETRPRNITVNMFIKIN